MEKLKELLSKHEKVNVDKFLSYVEKLRTEKGKDGSLKNSWMSKFTDQKLSEFYERVAKEGIVFDGVHVTLQFNGISYDYTAYKNKMLVVYPESKIDMALVYEGDEFEAEKDSGSVKYKHKIVKTFERTDDKIIGGYCIIKNKRGENLTTLTKDEFEKHRKVARTDYIWKQWYVEMCLKTVIKKACKQHYSDIFKNIEEVDNENYNLDNPLELDIELKGRIDACKDKEELRTLYLAEKDKVTDVAVFNSYVNIKKKEFNDANTSNAPKVA